MRYLKSLFLVAAFTLTFSGLRAEDVIVDSIKYRIVDNTEVSVVGYVEGIKNAVIKDNVDGFKVTNIGYAAFMNCRSLFSIIIPESVTSIEASSFWGCGNLTSITLSDNLRSIGNSAFVNCSNLTYINLPAKLINIDRFAFGGCSSLISMSIPESVTKIGDNAFQNCVSLTTINLPNSITRIESSLFYGCSSLTSISIPENVSSIGDQAFCLCVGLTSITIPNGVKQIENNSFYGCSSLESINLSDSLKSIGSNAFKECISLTSVTIPEGVTKIYDGAFSGCNGLIKVIIPNGIKEIVLNTFSGCSKVRDLSIPWDCSLQIYGRPTRNNFGQNGDGSINSITITGDSVADYDIFKYLDNVLFFVDDAVFGSYVSSPGWKDINDRIFCLNLLKQTEVQLTADPNRSSLFSELGNNSHLISNLKIKGSINGYDIMALRNKTIRLLYLDLSEADIVANDDGYEYYTGCSLRKDNELGEFSFAQTLLREVVLPQSLVSIENKAFEGCRFLEKVVISDKTINIGNRAFYNCYRLNSVNLPNSLETIGEYTFYNCTNLSWPVLRIPGNVRTIDNGAFEGCSMIDSVVIGNNVSEINDITFRNSGVTTVVLGSGVNQIGDGAFENCKNLNSVVFNRKLSIISPHAFHGCSNLKEASMPYSVKRIGNYAFDGCASLKTIKIPSMAQYIGAHAFWGCDSIENVYTYTVEPTDINQETFSCYKNAMLNVPKTSADLYIYDTRWSQFLFVQEFDEPYDAFYLNGDVELTDKTGRMSGEPDAEMNSTSGFIIEGDAKQELSTLELIHDGTNGASIIGASKDVTGSQVNLTAKSMNVNISVEGNRWYFFCFPFNVALDSIECSSEYIIYSYDGQKRAGEGTGWNRLGAQTAALEKGLGYIFQASKTGILTIHVGSDYLTFTANNEKEALHTYESTDAANASWNFVGNPFISYYDVKDLAAEYDAPIVVWNGNGYDAYKPGDDDYQLHPFQAFFVQKASGKQSIEFKPESRKTYNQAVAKTEERAKQRAATGIAINPERLLVNITIKNAEDLTDRTRIVYNDKAKMEYEIGTDISKFHTDGVPQLYTLNGTTRYAINERPMGGDEIKLGYIAPKAGVYTLSVPRQDAEIEIYDNVAQAVVDFTFGDYTFESAAGTYNDRFVVRKTGGVTAIKNGFRLDGLTVTATNGGLDIEGRMAGKVSVYTESGMLIAEPAQTGRLELADGVYIIKVEGSGYKIVVE